MSSLSESIRCDLITMIDEAPQPFTFNGVEYVGASSGLNRRRETEIGGFMEMPELTVAVNLRYITGDLVFGQDRPKPGDRVTVDGITYRVDRTEVDDFEECLQMDLKSENK